MRRMKPKFSQVSCKFSLGDSKAASHRKTHWHSALCRPLRTSCHKGAGDRPVQRPSHFPRPGGYMQRTHSRETEHQVCHTCRRGYRAVEQRYRRAELGREEMRSWARSGWNCPLHHSDSATSTSMGDEKRTIRSSRVPDGGATGRSCVVVVAALSNCRSCIPRATESQQRWACEHEAAHKRAFVDKTISQCPGEPQPRCEPR